MAAPIIVSVILFNSLFWSIGFTTEVADFSPQRAQRVQRVFIFNHFLPQRARRTLSSYSGDLFVILMIPFFNTSALKLIKTNDETKDVPGLDM